MARISNKEWTEYCKSKTARGSVREVSMDDLKAQAYDTLFELSSAWCVAFAVNLRDAVYCEWWDKARQMLDGKRGEAKDRALTVIRDLENMAKGE